MNRLERWQRAVEWPLVAAALVFLLAYGLPIVIQVSPAVGHWCDAFILLTWLLFAMEYLVRFALAPRKAAFVRTNLLDLFVIALPILRPLRLLRLVALLSVLNRAGAQTLRGRVIVYVVGGASLLVLCAGLAITDAERGHLGSNIEDFGDGIWWAVTTMTTVGYGDRYPVTITGRVVAFALMLGGIALLGVVTATLASWLVQRVEESNEGEQAATRAQVSALSEQIELLRAELTASRTNEADGRSGTTRVAQ